MTEDRARILVLGKSSTKGKQPLKEMLTEVFTEEIPAEFIETITVIYKDNSSEVLEPIQTLYLDDVNQYLQNYNISKPFRKLEVILDLDLVYEKIISQSDQLLSQYFNDNT